MNASIDKQSSIARAAEAIRHADALLLGAGAGIGVDSGLPDFRGNAGFWTAYPALYGMQFHEVANPRWFTNDPAFAWGFYGHRLNLYRQTTPHKGFAILRRWAQSMSAGYFVFTSNVDGQFQKAGFPENRLIECHGSIHHLQCVNACNNAVWPVGDLKLEIKESTLRCSSPLPRCPQCDRIARPNILMFGDAGWLDQRLAEQYEQYQLWKRSLTGKSIVAIEIGAGMAIPTVRYFCEAESTTHIRINPHEHEIAPPGIPLSMGALAGLVSIDAELRSISAFA